MISNLIRCSYAEFTPRERISAIVDEGTFREVLDPFDRVSSPYLIEQSISPQRDDGVVIGPAQLAGRRISAIAVDGRFLGGSVGEIGGAKIARALERAESGAILLLDTGGIRLQEANLGLLALAEICDAVVALRERAPVVSVIAGRVGCYGGMSIVASLCSSIIMSSVGRLGLNGPEVVEQEAGIREFDSRDRPAIWQATGGIRRVEQGHADILVDDEIGAIRQALIDAFAERPNQHRLNVERLHRSFAEEAQS
jgi:malonate decarboxylase beta subunit